MDVRFTLFLRIIYKGEILYYIIHDSFFLRLHDVSGVFYFLTSSHLKG